MAMTAEGLPPARSTRHHGSLLWWLALASAAALVYWNQTPAPSARTPAPASAGGEREAFLALAFPRIGDTLPEALSAAAFRDQMAALQRAGYTPVGLGEIENFFRKHAALPAHPLLLAFTEAQRETMDIADATFASLGIHGVFFVNLEALENANIDLVSRHRLLQLVNSGRWEIGIDGGAGAAAAIDDGLSLAFPLDEYARQRRVLEQWTGRPVRAIAYHRTRLEGQPQEAAWERALAASGFTLGFISALPQANYVDRSPLRLRSLRVSKEWTANDLLLRVAASEPRRSRFVDDFRSAQPSPAWVSDYGDIAIDGRGLKISAKRDQNGALVWLAGSDRWSDSAVTVELSGDLRGQFWVSLRSRLSPPFLRLGVAEGRAVLQKSDREGEIHDVAAREVGREKITLTLRMVGARVVAEVDGRPLTERPAEIPDGMREGALALAVWSTDPGEASAHVERVAAEPFPPILALLPAEPDAAQWEELRRRVDAISILSPRADGAPSRGGTAVRGSAVAIFAHYHHLSLYPALVVDHRLEPEESRALLEQALDWAADPGVKGINLALASAVAHSEQAAQLVSMLRSSLAESRKSLIVTALGGTGIAPGLPRPTDVFHLQPSGPGPLGIAVAPLALVKPSS